MCVLTGVNIRKHSIPISHVYSSPALRCVQTTHMMLKGSKNDDLVQPICSTKIKSYRPIHIKLGCDEYK